VAKRHEGVTVCIVRSQGVSTLQVHIYPTCHCSSLSADVMGFNDLCVAFVALIQRQIHAT
jgi:hypothetical protein